MWLTRKLQPGLQSCQVSTFLAFVCLFAAEVREPLPYCRLQLMNSEDLILLIVKSNMPTSI